MMKYELKLNIKLHLLNGQEVNCPLTILTAELIDIADCREAVSDAFYFMQDQNFKRTPEQFAFALSKTKPDWDIVLRPVLESCCEIKEMTLTQQTFSGIEIL